MQGQQKLSTDLTDCCLLQPATRSSCVMPAACCHAGACSPNRIAFGASEVGDFHSSIAFTLEVPTNATAGK